MSRLLLLSSLFLILALPAWSEPPTKAQLAEVERLIKQLGSDSFAEREAASKAIEGIGEPALEALQKAAKHGDAELRKRAAELVKVIEKQITPQRQSQALSVVKRLGGRCVLDEKRPDKPIVGVDLSGTQAADEDLVNFRFLTELEGIGLVGTKVTDAGLAHLTGLERLRSLGLTGTRVTDVGLEKLKGLRGLTWLDLAEIKITDAGLAHLSGLKSLGYLNLRKTGVSDAGLAHLKGLNELYWLRLSGTKVTDAGLAHLKALRNIVWLELNDTSVTDAGLEHVRALKRLRRLELKRTKVTKEGATALKQNIEEFSSSKFPGEG